MAKRIIVHLQDLPSKKSIIDAISRLKKDYELLRRCRGKKDKEDPNSLRSVMGFLESVMGQRVNVEDEILDDSALEVLMLLMSKHLTEEVSSEYIESTGLGQWARDYATKSSDN